MERITTVEDLRRGAAELARRDADFAAAIEAVGELPLRLSTPDFAGLASIIVSQQVSKASADAIFSRLRQLADPLEPGTVLAAQETLFRAAGLSRPKQRTLLAAAAAIEEGRLDLLSLCSLSPREAIAQMVQVKGIGPWTAEIYLLFCAGHADILPAGDLALQEATRTIFRLAERPGDRALREFGERWAPFRGVAARILWAHYSLSRGVRDVTPA